MEIIKYMKSLEYDLSYIKDIQRDTYTRSTKRKAKHSNKKRKQNMLHIKRSAKIKRRRIYGLR